MYNIAIDGPSGAGKSTIAKILASKLQIAYLDTGAMYRAVALHTSRSKIDFDNIEQVASNLERIDISIVVDNSMQKILVNGENVTTAIREHDISAMASKISAIPCVRLFLVKLQRQIASHASCILDGRDIGTYVLPHAKYKFFLTASVDIRAKRRYDELCAKGQRVELSNIKADIVERDYNDSHREFAPLCQAKDAVLIDTTLLDIDEAANTILSYIKEQK